MRRLIVLESLEGRRLLSHWGPTGGPDSGPPGSRTPGDVMPFDRSGQSPWFDHGGPGHGDGYAPAPWHDAPPAPDGWGHGPRSDGPGPNSGAYPMSVSAQAQFASTASLAEPGPGGGPARGPNPMFGRDLANAFMVGPPRPDPTPALVAATTIVARTTVDAAALFPMAPAVPLIARPQTIAAGGTGPVAMLDLPMGPGALMVQGRPQAWGGFTSPRDPITAETPDPPPIQTESAGEIAAEAFAESEVPAEVPVVPAPQLADLLTRFWPIGPGTVDLAIAGFDDANPAWRSPIRLAVASLAMAVSALATGAILRERRPRADVIEAQGGLVLFPGLPGRRGGRPS